MTPKDRKYAKTHEWVKVDGDTAVVGITDHAQSALGDITFIDLPAEGTEVAQGDELCVIESVKAASDIYAPVGGTVSEVNGALEDAPEVLNQNPYEAGWILKLSGIDASQLEGLLDGDGYAAMLD